MTLVMTSLLAEIIPLFALRGPLVRVVFLPLIMIFIIYVVPVLGVAPIDDITVPVLNQA